MTNKCFNSLSMSDKAVLLYAFGQPLMAIDQPKYKIYLYSLNGKLIDLYENRSTRKIDKIEAVNYNGLDKHLDNVVVWKSGILSKLTDQS